MKKTYKMVLISAALCATACTSGRQQELRIEANKAQILHLKLRNSNLRQMLLPEDKKVADQTKVAKNISQVQQVFVENWFLKRDLETCYGIFKEALIPLYVHTDSSSMIQDLDHVGIPLEGVTYSTVNEQDDTTDFESIDYTDERNEPSAPGVNVVTMEGIVFNIANSKARRYGSIDICVETTSPHVTSFKKREDGEKATPYKKILAATIEIASSKSLDDLTSPDQRRAFALELKTRYNEIIEAKTGKKDAVSDVYFPKFLIQ